MVYRRTVSNNDLSLAPVTDCVSGYHNQDTVTPVAGTVH